MNQNNFYHKRKIWLIAAGDDIERLLPEIAFLPDGYIEPSGEIRLAFDSIRGQLWLPMGRSGRPPW